MQRPSHRRSLVARWLAARPAIVALCALAAPALGCIRAPAVVIVDRKTAVEQQASGSFRGLEEELEQAGLVPGPAPLTAAQLAAAGVGRDGTEAGRQDDDAGNDAVRTDALLVKRCLGEALDGTLVLTLAPCTGTVDVPQVGRMVERVNRERRQLWRWLGSKAPERSAQEVLGKWREVHLVGLVCGGQLEVAAGSWEVKRC
jgi:hypothetical protein